ncbi:MAG: formate hydrogenlyase subunit 6/NADH:ubiquinone oxidoreductase subunit I [Roseivirga sp.]
MEIANDMSKYWKNITIATKTLKEGLKVTFEHMKDATTQRDPLYVDEENYFEKQNGIFTTQYPKEVIPVPDNGRYKLHNEIEDCIVCDKCAKVCPVDCIDIEPVRSAEEIGKTSDGTPKRIYAAKFDIDMSKCCFCGLCTTVCPTECLTMTKEYDFSVFNVEEHNFEFGEMTPLEILEKKKAFEEYTQKKEEERARLAATIQPKVATSTTNVAEKPAGVKPVFRPKPMARPVPKPSTASAENAATPKPNVVMRPQIQVKKAEDKTEATSEEIPKAAKPENEAIPKTTKPKVVMRPQIQVKKKDSDSNDKAE